jgi:hypothetical protein
VIINRGSEPEETPEHNALQVKFLDDDFCLRFMRCFCTEFDEIARKELQEVLDRWARDAQKKLEEKKRELEQVRERLKDIAEYEAGRSTYRPYQSAENLRSETLKITAIPRLWFDTAAETVSAPPERSDP